MHSAANPISSAPLPIGEQTDESSKTSKTGAGEGNALAYLGLFQ
jgi:hypothetical protein